MSTARRIIIAIFIIIAVSASILIIDSYRNRGERPEGKKHTGPRAFSAGCVPIYTGKDEPSHFCQEDSIRLKKAGFIDRKENKLQEGWLLRDVLLLRIRKEELKPDSLVRVESSSRGKKAEITWKQICDESNRIILVPSKQGLLKLASSMKGLDARDRWVQEVDRIEVVRR